MMMKVRRPAVAGAFYPNDPVVLQKDIEVALAAADSRGPVPRAMIAPHAGYVYSGPVAASAYARLMAASNQICEVVLFGPSHRVAFNGLALCSAEAYATPLGQVQISSEMSNTVMNLAPIQILDDAHLMEHSLEVQLPFLQVVLNEFSLLPIVIGNASPQDVAEVIRLLWKGPERLFVISSDLSHYLSYEEAQQTDQRTTRAIENLDTNAIGYEQACGRTGIEGLLLVAKEKQLKEETVDIRNSGDTAGPKDQVVGYGSYIFT